MSAVLEKSFAAQQFEVARAYAQVKSDDPDKKVGVVLSAFNRGLVACNKLTPGIKASAMTVERPWKYFFIEHAERNAIAEGQRLWGSVRGMDMYLPWFPCADCARAMVMAGVDSLYCVEPTFTGKWADSHRAASSILRQGGVEVYYVAGEKEPE